MTKTLQSRIRKARKEHRCDFCNHKIAKGEQYVSQSCVCDGRAYTWKEHLHCRDLASAIWDYVDPDGGMTETEFCDAIYDLMPTFYCPFHCDKWNENDGCADQTTDQCLRRFAQFMETHRLELAREENFYMSWRMVEKGGAE